MSRILVVEDDAQISKTVTEALTEEGHVVTAAEDGEAGLSEYQNQAFDLVILDLMLPKRDGLSVLHEIRQQGQRVPVIILSAKSSVDDRLVGLKSGGDDYLVKPFSLPELLLRVQIILRRMAESKPVSTLEHEDLRVDLLSREVRRAGRKIDLQTREFALLEILMREPGKVLSKNFILEKVWDYRFDPQTNVVDVLVCRLRAKVDKDFDSKLIQTIRGVGYALSKN